MLHSCQITTEFVGPGGGSKIPRAFLAPLPIGSLSFLRQSIGGVTVVTQVISRLKALVAWPVVPVGTQVFFWGEK